MFNRFFVIGLILFMAGIYVTQWTPILGTIVGISGGVLMGISTAQRVKR
ncbi:hypothetical protein [Priestia koreensis]|nr:hypothetical protein [Priestia koreensis]MCM3004044.1 hypothetical protein [Priestia koreensis]UNL83268.1 hypothetical protein IE339_13915 [Priestia koreensis]